MSFIGNCGKVIEKRLAAYERPPIDEEAALHLAAIKEAYQAKRTE